MDKTRLLHYTLALITCLTLSGNGLSQVESSHYSKQHNQAELIKGAITLIEQKRYKQAEALLDLINPEALPAHTRLTYTLKKAQLYLADHQAKQALTVLRTLSPQRLTTTDKRVYYELKATAYSQLNNVFETIKTRTILNHWLTNTQAIKSNQAIIWSEVGQLSKAALKSLNPNIPGDPTSAWMALALIYKSYPNDPKQLQHQLKQWQKAFPGTLSIDTLPYEVHSALTTRFWHINKIALLLPTRGPYQKAAQAIKQGIITAYYQSMSARPTLAIYDTQDGSQAYSAYQLALQQGADMVIGPLSKQAVQQLQYNAIPIPTLALNKPKAGENTPQPRELYYFSLSPTYEAEQAADRAWQEGYHNAITLTANTPRGKRIAAAFKARWRKLGGNIKNSMVFSSPQAIHYGLSSLLKVRESQQRYKALRRLLDSSVEFQPRPRKDIDFLFFSAQNQEAIQIKPLLRFYFAEQLPVISLSNTYYERENISTDLDGIKIMATPWSLSSDHKLKQQLDYASSIWQTPLRNNNLFALGMDAYDLALHINQLQNHSNYVMNGMTGKLQLSPDNVIRPQLIWVTYHEGKIQTLVHPGGRPSHAS